MLTPKAKRVNSWYGANLVAEADAGGNGKYILLSWTAQLQSGTNNGIYQVQLAMLEFDTIPPNPAASAPTGMTTDAVPNPTASGSALSSKYRHKLVNTALNVIEKGLGQSLIAHLGYSKASWKWHSGIIGLAVLLLLDVGALRL